MQNERASSPDSVISFWFKEIKPQQWWKKDFSFDRRIHQKFIDIHRQARECELYFWRQTPHGRLAEIIVLDQFSRNIFRDTAEAFAADPQALSLAQEAVAGGFDKLLHDDEKAFLYMPYMHSESKNIHLIAEKLFSAPGLEANFTWEKKHKAIIDRFGRYPHRNQILGRSSTAEEEKFLRQPGSSF